MDREDRNERPPIEPRARERKAPPASSALLGAALFVVSTLLGQALLSTQFPVVTLVYIGFTQFAYVIPLIVGLMVYRQRAGASVVAILAAVLFLTNGLCMGIVMVAGGR